MTDTPPSPARLPTDMLCQIAVPVPIMRAEKTVYDYLASSAFQLSYGDIVLVPLGSQQVWGIVVGLEQTGDMPSSRLKHILGRADLPPISKLNLAYLEQLSKWTVAPFGAVMKLMLNCPQALVPPPSVMMYRLADDWQERLAESAITMTSQRNRLIEFMASAPR